MKSPPIENPPPLAIDHSSTYKASDRFVLSFPQVITNHTLDLDAMTLIFKLYLDIVMTYPQTKIGFRTLAFSLSQNIVTVAKDKLS